MNSCIAKSVSSDHNKVSWVTDPENSRSWSNAHGNTVSFITLWRESGEAKTFLGLVKTRPYTGTPPGLYLVKPLPIYFAFTVGRRDNKESHKKESSKLQLPFPLINCGQISFNLNHIKL